MSAKATIGFVFLALALSACADKAGARYVFVTAHASGAKFYIDSSSVKDDGAGIIQAVELADYPDDGSDWRSMTSLVLYNCTADTSAVIRSTFFSGPEATGKIVRTREESKVFKSPPTGQPAALLNRAACKAAGVGPNNSFKPNPLRGSA